MRRVVACMVVIGLLLLPSMVLARDPFSPLTGPGAGQQSNPPDGTPILEGEVVGGPASAIPRTGIDAGRWVVLALLFIAAGSALLRLDRYARFA